MLNVLTPEVLPARTNHFAEAIHVARCNSVHSADSAAKESIKKLIRSRASVEKIVVAAV